MDKSILQLCLLAVFLLILFLKEKLSGLKKVYPWLLILLVLFGAIAHFNFFRFHGPLGHFHNLEMYHYFMGAKYFPENGYTGLYEASLIADAEDDPYFNLELAIRSLKDYSYIARKDVLSRRGEIVTRFSPERWGEFRRDQIFFRQTAPTNWGTKFGYLDHGYNGTPLVTVVLSAMSSQKLFSTELFQKTAPFLDIFLILFSAVILGVLIHKEAGLLFLLFFFLNPLNDYSMIGGGFLRYEFLVTLMLSIVCYRKKHFAVSGVFLAASALFRIFPGFFFIGIFLNHLFQKNRREVFEKHRGFYWGFITAGLGLMIATSFIQNPAAKNPWLSFKEQIAIQSAQPAANKIGMKGIFSFSDRHNIQRVLQTWPDGERLNWAEETNKTFQKRAPFYYGLFLLWLLGAGLFLIRIRDSSAFAGGFFVIFAGLMLSHYYYAALSLIPLIFAESKKSLAITAGAFFTVIFLPLFPEIGGVTDRRFFSWSFSLFLFLAVILLINIIPRFSKKSV